MEPEELIRYCKEFNKNVLEKLEIDNEVKSIQAQDFIDESENGN